MLGITHSQPFDKKNLEALGVYTELALYALGCGIYNFPAFETKL